MTWPKGRGCSTTAASGAEAAPARDGLALLCDAETSRRRTLWVRPALRARWRDAALARRARLDAIFADRGLRPFTLRGAFDAQALSSHLLEDMA